VIDCDYSRMLRLCLPIVSLSADYQTPDRWRRAEPSGKIVAGRRTFWLLRRWNWASIDSSRQTPHSAFWLRDNGTKRPIRNGVSSPPYLFCYLLDFGSSCDRPVRSHRLRLKRLSIGLFSGYLLVCVSIKFDLKLKLQGRRKFSWN